MLVSVIMPAFNYGRYIGAAIESVLRQVHSDLELLVVDDGSTDNTAEVLRGVTDPRVRLYRLKNGGVSRARNHALDRAQGDAIAFLDADDVWLPHKLSAQVRVLQEQPSVGFVASNFVRFANDGTELSDQFRFMPHTVRMAQQRQLHGAYGILPGNALVAFCGEREMPWYPPANLVRRSVVHDIRFPEGVRLGEDLHYFSRVWIRTRAALVSEVGLRVRQHDSNSSRNAGETHHQRTIDQFMGLLALNLTPQQMRAVRRRIAMEWASLGFDARQQRRYDAAAEAYSRACAIGGATWRIRLARALVAGRAVLRI
jgi:glycosyltransferase involved in cell wall biosynthesis